MWTAFVLVVDFAGMVNVCALRTHTVATIFTSLSLDALLFHRVHLRPLIDALMVPVSMALMLYVLLLVVARPGFVVKMVLAVLSAFLMLDAI
jgi:hypothetical protein